MSENLDHDALFKQVLTEFFVEFLALFFPDLHAQLDLDEITFLDKESFVALIDPDRREADMVAQVRLLGKAATFIIHIEHQAQPEQQLDRRMFRYFARFYDRYNMPVYPIALCSYSSPKRAEVDRHQLNVAGLDVLDFRYRVVQLNRLNWRDYLNSDNPLAAALMARMQIAPRDRWRVKAACFRAITGLPLNGKRRQLLSQFVDLYLPLRPAEEKAFQQEVTSFSPAQKEVFMTMMTSWERKGRAEGLVEGELIGQRSLLLRMLARKFGPLPEALEQRIEALDRPQLESLGEALLDFTTLTDVDAWLDHHPPAEA